MPILSARRRPRAWRLIPLCMISLSPGCVGTPAINATPSACVDLLPKQWNDAVPGAPLPAEATVGSWMIFGELQTGQLEKANGRTADAIGIVTRCEARDRAVIDKARRPWWKRIF